MVNGHEPVQSRPINNGVEWEEVRCRHMPLPGAPNVGGFLQPDGGMHTPNPSLGRVWGSEGMLDQETHEHGKHIRV
jgi:hypothetical protein